MTLDTTNLIDITHLDPRKLIKNAYNLSRPQGLGYLQPYQNELTEKEIDEILAAGEKVAHIKIRMDYVNGRSVKLTVFEDQDEGTVWMYDTWYDHSPEALETLLETSAP